MVRDDLRPLLRGSLLVAALATYLASPDDIVWRLIQGSPHARLWEHFAFGSAASMLGVALLLKFQASLGNGLSPGTKTIGNMLQAVGIGFLLPLPGFLLVVIGELGINLLVREGQPSAPGDARHSRAAPWTDILLDHLALSCAFGSMIVFSIVLVDRVADELFATTAVIALAASSRNALKARASRP